VFRSEKGNLYPLLVAKHCNDKTRQASVFREAQEDNEKWKDNIQINRAI
jgi:hypothetical protein